MYIRDQILVLQHFRHHDRTSGDPAGQEHQDAQSTEQILAVQQDAGGLLHQRDRHLTQTGCQLYAKEPLLMNEKFFILFPIFFRYSFSLSSFFLSIEKLIVTLDFAGRSIKQCNNAQQLYQTTSGSELISPVHKT